MQVDSVRPSAAIKAYDFKFGDDGLMVIRWRRTASEEESRELMRLVAAVWERRIPYAGVIVSYPEVNADAKHRQIWGEWQAAHQETISAYCKGMALTLDSSAVRAVMTVLSWFSPRPLYPIVYVRSEEEAVAWARERLRSSV